MHDRIEAPGIYPDMRTEDYFADPCPWPSLSQSIAKILLDRSPRHAWHAHPRLNPDWKPDEDKYEKAKAIGNAAHKLVLGRGKKLGMVSADDFRSKNAKAARDIFVAEGKTPILHKHLLIAENIEGALIDQLALAKCGDAFREGHGNAEVVITAFDEQHGIWLRSMVDWLASTTVLYDLKTGETSAAPHAIPKRMVDQGWDVQAAMQERILDILDPKNAGRRRFRFVAIEDDEPYALTVNEIPESAMEMGRRKLGAACRLWAECMQRNEWPAYPPMIYRPEYPGYAERSWLEREIVESERVPFVPEVINAG